MTAHTEPTTPSRTRLTGDERRRRILAAAIPLLAEHGYDAVSVGEIAEAAGCSKPVLYDHFPSKAQLAIAAVEETGAALMEHVTAAVLAAAGESRRRQLERGFEAFFEFTERNPLACRMVFRDPSRDPDVLQAHVRVHRNATAGVTALFAGGLEGEPDPRRVELFAHITTSALAALAVWWDDHPSLTRDELVAAMMDYAFVGLERLTGDGA